MQGQQNTLRSLFMVVTLLVATSAIAQTKVYITRDADGNPIFSDRKSAGSETHVVDELPSMPAFAVPAPIRPTDKTNDAQPVQAYTSLSIISPADGTSLPQGLNGEVRIAGVLTPGLQGDDEIVLRDAGTEIMRGTQTTFEVTNLDRGEHRLTMEVVTPEGDVAIRSQTITLFVQRTSSLAR